MVIGVLLRKSIVCREIRRAPFAGIVPIFACMLLAAFQNSTVADQAADEFKDKIQFSLLKPTPTKYLREMTTDGHGATQSPYTVDAGHFQVELTGRYVEDNHSVDRQIARREATLGPMLLKAGLFNSVDAEVLLDPFTYIQERAAGTRRVRKGFGDATLRLKANIWGNDEGRSAGAVIPYVTLPTRDKELGEPKTEPGLIFPVSIALSESFYLDLTAKVGGVWSAAERRDRTEYSQSGSLGCYLSKDLFVYVEIFSAFTTQAHEPWLGVLDGGVLYWLSKNVQISLGLNCGLTRSADDWNPFVAMAWRY
jgi:hypothetical protein